MTSLEKTRVSNCSTESKKKAQKLFFEIYREKFYDIGIYVFKDSFKDNAISGLCVKDNRFPVIVINNSMSFARQIFTLFHELYHLISDTSGAEIIRDDFFSMLDEGQSDIERNCDSFANSFLVPLADFKPFALVPECWKVFWSRRKNSPTIR